MSGNEERQPNVHLQRTIELTANEPPTDDQRNMNIGEQSVPHLAPPRQDEVPLTPPRQDEVPLTPPEQNDSVIEHSSITSRYEAIVDYIIKGNEVLNALNFVATGTSVGGAAFLTHTAPPKESSFGNLFLGMIFLFTCALTSTFLSLGVKVGLKHLYQQQIHYCEGVLSSYIRGRLSMAVICTFLASMSVCFISFQSIMVAFQTYATSETRDDSYIVFFALLGLQLSAYAYFFIGVIVSIRMLPSIPPLSTRPEGQTV